MTIDSTSIRRGFIWGELRPILTILLFTVLALRPSPAAAQYWPAGLGAGLLGQLTSRPVTDGHPNQVFSSNPVGLMVEFYNFEYEVRLSDSLTGGAGASRLGWRPFSAPVEPYINSDVFVRYYPSGSAFNGLAIGFKAGPTKLSEEGTFWGVGLDLNQSAAINDHVVFSTGVGVKRLFRHLQDGTFLVPTFRIIQVGIGF